MHMAPCNIAQGNWVRQQGYQAYVETMLVLLC